MGCRLRGVLRSLLSTTSPHSLETSRTLRLTGLQISDLRHILERCDRDDSDDSSSSNWSRRQSEDAPYPAAFKFQREPHGSFPTSGKHNLSIASSIVPGLDLSSFHPPHEDCAWSLLRIYFANVDPLIRLIHRPSFYETLQKFFRNIYDRQSENGACLLSSASISTSAASSHGYNYIAPSRNGLSEGSYQQSPARMRAFEALLFAVYHAAASSLTKSDAGRDQYADAQDGLPTLFKNYRRPTELALENTDFMQSRSLETLQALVLLLVGDRSPAP